VLGGLSQTREAAPVQFYRFTNEQKKSLQQKLYIDPFKPTQTEESLKQTSGYSPNSEIKSGHRADLSTVNDSRRKSHK